VAVSMLHSFWYRGRTDVLFAQRRTERIAQMANHLMSGHAAPTPLAIGAHLAQTMEHFVPVAIIHESFHALDVHSTP